MNEDDKSLSKRTGIGILPSETYSGVDERRTHPEGKLFRKFFDRLLIVATKSCWERDVIRGSQEYLWERWKDRAALDGEKKDDTDQV